ncbi:MAG: hypothetical protein JW723_08495 [Bacteroidales bacterium]|nr:hypothetical protein [Bacteroidales bacterium]
MNPSKREFIIISAMILIVVSCGSRGDVPLNKAVLQADTCKYNTGHTYFVYLPAHSSDCKTMPLVIIIDPHGSGGYAINHFIEAAETYKFILGASNMIRNNYEDYNRAIEVLINDMKDKYPAGDRTFLAGFSGGARMVLSYAQNHKTNGVLACGALASPDRLSSVKAYIYVISGRADFNFPEAAHYILNEADKPSNLKLQLTGTLHQWPSSEDLSHALGWLYLNERPSDTKCIPLQTVLKSFSEKGKKLVESSSQNRQYIQMRLICQNMLEIRDLPDKEYFREATESMINNRNLNDEISQLRKCLQFEYRVREAYYDALSSKDTDWWDHEISELNSRIEDSEDLNMNFTLKRIKAFLGIICYSVANNALRTNDLTIAGKTLEIYKMVEPRNPDMFYFSALYSLKSGKSEHVSENINKALENGFQDTLQLKKEFPVIFWKSILTDE